MTGERVHNVLFLCTHNSARSVIAECVMNRLGRGRFKGFSAGSMPSGRIHPMALDLLGSLGYEIAGLASKSWQTFAEPGAPAMSFVFTVCDNAAHEVCPVWPGQPTTAHWGLPDPSAVAGTEAEKRYAFAETHRMLTRRIEAFVNLPLASLERLSLKRQLDTIGHMDESATLGARRA